MACHCATNCAVFKLTSCNKSAQGWPKLGSWPSKWCSITKLANCCKASGEVDVLAKCSKCPNRMKLGATRVTMAAVSSSSRRTGNGEPVRHSARVVGTPKPAMASLHKYSRMLDLSTARPSPMREYGVGPAPLS